MMNDPVNHPSHYAGQGSIECKELLKVVASMYHDYVAFCVCCIVKYCWRCHDKEPVRSLESARWYLNDAVSIIKSYPPQHKSRLFLDIMYADPFGRKVGTPSQFIQDVFAQMEKHFDKEEFGYFKNVVLGLTDGGLYRDVSLSPNHHSGRMDSFKQVGDALDGWIAYLKKDKA